MAHLDDVIVLDDDDDDEEEKPQCSEGSKSSVPLTPQTNGRNGDGEIPKNVYGMSAENSKLFEEFVEYCSNLTQEHPEVIIFLQRKLSRANPTFLSSVEFRNVLGRCLTRVQSKSSKVYVYINELCTSLKANSQKRKLTLRPSTLSAQPAKKEQQSEEEEEEIEEKAEEPTRKSGSKRQIRYLENLLRIYSREIQKLQEKELSLDELEDEDSSYIQEARLKRKLIRIFEKLCELKECPSLTGRVIEQRIPYRGTRYPEVNRRLEKFINGTRGSFPDYGDVLRVIQRASERHGLGLPRKQMQGMAQDAFRELGNILQERRHLDMVYNFGCHLTDSYKPVGDPAHQDPMLARRLRENRSTALSNLNTIIKKYAALQDEGEEEERSKKKKESEIPSSSKDGKVSPTEDRETPSPPSLDSGEDEESEESETDIEEELKQAQQVTDEDEDDDEAPANEENDGDQRMEIPSVTQTFSSGGEDDIEEEREDYDIIEEDGDEQIEPGASPPLSPLSDNRETTILEMELLPISPCLPTQSPGSPSSADNVKENGAQAVGSSSEVVNVKDCTEVSIKDNSGDGTVDGNSNVERIPSEEGNLSCLENKSADLERDLSFNVESSVEQDGHDGLGNKESNLEGTAQDETDHVGSSQDCSTSDSRESPCISGSEDYMTHVDTETKSSSEEGKVEDLCVESSTIADTDVLTVTNNCAESAMHDKVPHVESNVDTEACCIESSSTASITQVIAEVSCVGSSMEIDNDSISDKSNAKLDSDVPCGESSLNDDSEDSRGSSKVGTSGDSNICEDTEVSHVGSSNGVVQLTDQEEDKNVASVGSSGDSHTIESGKNNTASLTHRKRKRSPPQTLLENGKRAFNGSKQNRGETNCKRAKRDRLFVPLPSSPNSDSDSSESSPDLSLEMMVSCSPKEATTPPSTPRHKSHASTQCDPDEVIVLSD